MRRAARRRRDFDLPLPREREESPRLLVPRPLRVEVVQRHRLIHRHPLHAPHPPRPPSARAGSLPRADRPGAGGHTNPAESASAASVGRIAGRSGGKGASTGASTRKASQCDPQPRERPAGRSTGSGYPSGSGGRRGGFSRPNRRPEECGRIPAGDGRLKACSSPSASRSRSRSIPAAARDLLRALVERRQASSGGSRLGRRAR